MSTLTQLEYLIAVDREKNFSLASKNCFVSQPSLSIQIKKLEEELGVIVFDRSKQPIVATQEGKVVIEQAKVILKEHKKLHALAQMQSHEPQGEFKLAVIPTLASFVIPLFVSSFSKNYPKVHLIINEYKTEDIIKLLAQDDIDAGLLVTPLGDERIIERHLFFEPFYCYVGPNHPLSSKKIISEDDLDGKNLWLLSEGHCFRDQVLKICSLDKKKGILPNIEFESGNLETLKKMVRNASGYTLLPELAVEELEEEEKKLFIRKFKKPVPTREVSLVYGRSFLKEAIIEALEKSILSGLPKKIKSLKRSEIDVVDIY